MDIYINITERNASESVQTAGINDIINEKLPVIHRKVYAGTTKAGHKSM